MRVLMFRNWAPVPAEAAATLKALPCCSWNQFGLRPTVRRLPASGFWEFMGAYGV